MNDLPVPPPADAAWAYFLDVDGTLAPLASIPSAARVPERARQVVRALHARTRGAVALVSGRAIADIDRLLGEPPLPAAGQHGTELRPDPAVATLRPAESIELAPARAALGEFVSRHTGLLLEDKGQSLAVHYRGARLLEDAVRHAVRAEASALGEGYCIQRGNCVVELKPAGANKGGAIAAFMALAPFRGRVPVFVGDDTTDEDGFKQVNLLGGHSIRVGAGRSAAQYRLKETGDVVDWLEGALQE